MSETTSLPQVLQDPLGDPKGKGDCGVELGLVSLTSNGLYPRAWFWYFVVCNESQSPLSWKKEMSPQCQVYKLYQAFPAFTQKLLNFSVLLFYQPPSTQSCLGPLKLC